MFAEMQKNPKKPAKVAPQTQQKKPDVAAVVGQCFCILVDIECCRYFDTVGIITSQYFTPVSSHPEDPVNSPFSGLEDTTRMSLHHMAEHRTVDLDPIMSHCMKQWIWPRIGLCGGCG